VERIAKIANIAKIAEIETALNFRTKSSVGESQGPKKMGLVFNFGISGDFGNFGNLLQLFLVLTTLLLPCGGDSRYAAFSGDAHDSSGERKQRKLNCAFQFLRQHSGGCRHLLQGNAQAHA
jgi:hypothetical protein